MRTSRNSHFKFSKVSHPHLPPQTKANPLAHIFRLPPSTCGREGVIILAVLLQCLCAWERRGGGDSEDNPLRATWNNRQGGRKDCVFEALEALEFLFMAKKMYISASM